MLSRSLPEVREWATFCDNFLGAVDHICGEIRVKNMVLGVVFGPLWFEGDVVLSPLVAEEQVIVTPLAGSHGRCGDK